MQTLNYFKLLADDTRLKTLMLIYHAQELCVCELTTVLELSQPKISRHIALLRKAKLIHDRRDGKWIYYSLAHDMPDWQQEIIAASCEQEQFELTAMLAKLNQPDESSICQQLC